MSFFAAILFAYCVFPSDSTLTFATGETASGQLIEIADNELTFNADENESKFAFEQLAEIELADCDPRLEGRLRVTMIEGSKILARSFTSDEGKSIPVTVDGMKFEIENRNLQRVLLQPLDTDELKAEWENLKLTPLESGDAIVVKRKGQLETLEGVVGKISDETVEFKLDDRSAEIDRKKIYGVIYYRAGRELPSAKSEVTLINGSTIQSKSLRWSKGVVEIDTTAGSKFNLPSDSVARINFAVGRAKMLGDMTPTTSDWSPLMTRSAILEHLKKVRLPRANLSYSSEPLDLKFYPEPTNFLQPPERREFKSGYAMHGGSKLVFNLDGNFERLTGLAGFAPTADQSGNVTLQIRADNRSVLSQHMLNRYEQNPVEIDINVKGIKRLVIEVDYHDGRAVGDTLHLCDLKVSR